jgi:hypothetical protein
MGIWKSIRDADNGTLRGRLINSADNAITNALCDAFPVPCLFCLAVFVGLVVVAVMVFWFLD